MQTFKSLSCNNKPKSRSYLKICRNWAIPTSQIRGNLAPPQCARVQESSAPLNAQKALQPLFSSLEPRISSQSQRSEERCHRVSPTERRSPNPSDLRVFVKLLLLVCPSCCLLLFCTDDARARNANPLQDVLSQALHIADARL